VFSIAGPVVRSFGLAAFERAALVEESRARCAAQVEPCELTFEQAMCFWGRVVSARLRGMILWPSSGEKRGRRGGFFPPDSSLVFAQVDGLLERLGVADYLACVNVWGRGRFLRDDIRLPLEARVRSLLAKEMGAA
jgi:hypothetical protein